MGRSPCCSKIGLHRGPWTAKEDALLTQYIQIHGEGNWKSLPSKAGLLRCGKSCRLRWMNYLRPDIKRGNITPAEDDLIIRLHGLLGNRWSLIAGRLPGRTDNEIKNYWNTHLGKKLKCRGINLRTKKTKSDSKKAKNKKKMHKSSKVYLPKATRPTSFTCPWSLNDGGITGRFLMDDDEDDHGGLLNSCDLAHEQQSSNTDMMVEKVYEEYLELLNKDGNGGSLQGVELDSFDESLWAGW